MVKRLILLRMPMRIRARTFRRVFLMERAAACAIFADRLRRRGPFGVIGVQPGPQIIELTVVPAIIDIGADRVGMAGLRSVDRRAAIGVGGRPVRVFGVGDGLQALKPVRAGRIDIIDFIAQPQTNTLGWLIF